MTEKQKGNWTDAYHDAVRRIETESTMVNRDAALASIAISLKRIANALEKIDTTHILQENKK